MPGKYDDLRDPHVLALVHDARLALRTFLEALERLDEEQATGFHTIQSLLNSIRATRVDADLFWQDFRNLFLMLEDGFSWLPDEAWQKETSDVQ